MRNLASTFVALIFALVLSSCDSGVEWESGDYEVYWIDLPSELGLGRKLPDGNAIGRVEPQVFAVGEDKYWVVAGRYPDGDKSRPEFFYFAMADDSTYKNSEDVVLGPFTAEEFEKLKKQYSLPEWSKKF